MNKPTIVEVFADNGEHSHWTLIESETGIKLWSENLEECRTMGYPVKFCSHENISRYDGCDECLDCGARNY